ncbi:uncharacterized protein YfaT (DUF1175 family) [Cytobacillus eiseniae]|uniref:Uncharacterized protein YfaT (DUF1175 family) n=1 Tax=Cytobacillus eiseniae TaxID=762947 RepID=A0ABS4RFS0_9BACI|nr:hypothetical protein [Cytobacillus eiseniae]MBP2241753.1 uncharacterized protein YfaT (DUF1175 family) [Cytobacillus eiseniae]
MLTYSVLPDHIKQVAEKYNHSNEKLDCLPSKLMYEDINYYVVHYYPSLHDLFIQENGGVPPFEQVRRAILIVKVYQTAGNTLIRTGGKWVKEPTARNYRKLEQRLTSIKRKINKFISQEGLIKLDNIIEASRKINKDQDLIFECVDKGTELIDHANKTEMVNESIQQEVRNYVVKMVRAAVRQNQVQLDTEVDRKELLAYLGREVWKKPSILFDYLWFKKNVSYMLNSSSPTAKDMYDLQEMVSKEKTIDEMENADEMISLIRNPKAK